VTSSPSGTALVFQVASHGEGFVPTDSDLRPAGCHRPLVAAGEIDSGAARAAASHAPAPLTGRAWSRQTIKCHSSKLSECSLPVVPRVPDARDRARAYELGTEFRIAMVKVKTASGVTEPLYPAVPAAEEECVE
jgi:hypothetical protein